jgi:hypothetical protein
VDDAGPAGANAHKKRLRAAEQDRADMAAARRAWVLAAPSLDPARLVFLDGSKAPP